MSVLAIAEYVGLRPKLYSILRSDEQLIKKAKGIKQYVIKKQIDFANYKDALFYQKKIRTQHDYASIDTS